MFFQGLISILIPLIFIELAFRLLARKSLITWIFNITRLDENGDKTKAEKRVDKKNKDLKNVKSELKFTEKATDITTELIDKERGLNKAKKKLEKSEKGLNN